ncbi:glycosyltransferase [Jeotgalibacillus sp. S-D1]|uniref:glycosyltransferase n=1 Tax=Jeotgalibacillus sp. S-D1 TaxID=2552189 RepID=UPI001059547A|nr:glycosyltransferase [Jeotgalibacillus sp. S-D1]TDL31816.1 glycosyltransferase [Jeotgalibacillus sp. S-D1]
MKKILIASFDMEIGGVERSLVSMLNNFDYENYQVDLMLYRHQGDLMNLLSEKVTLLNEVPQYTTFRKTILENIREKQVAIAGSRILSKAVASVKGRVGKISEPGYYQMQLMWKYALPFLPNLEKEYDVAISYLWPHYYVAEKVKAKKKIAWIHTDFSTIQTDVKMDLKMWNKFDYIVAVSEACKESFVNKYQELRKKVIVIENITSQDFISSMAEENVQNPLVSDQRFKIITVARLSHAKGIDQAVRALRILKDKGFNNIVWYVVGYGGEEMMLRKLINDNDLEKDFILLGKKVNPYPLVKAADLYIQPSRYEGKAVTVGEAQILGKPVIITNYPTATSQLQSNVNGYICEITDKGIADGIEKLYNDAQLRESLAQKCRDSNFDNSVEMEKVYGLVN